MTADPVEEVRRIEACINDLTSVLALPAIWSGHEAPHVVSTLLDALLAMLRLDFAYARLAGEFGAAPIEVVRASAPAAGMSPEWVGARLAAAWTRGVSLVVPRVPNPVGEGEVSIVPFRLGTEDDAGVLVTGSRRRDFPTRTEMLLLRVAANQAAIGLREARLLSEQQRQRRRAEDERRALALLVEHSTDFIGMAATDGHMLFVNPAGRALVGLDGDDQVRASRVRDYIAEDDREQFETQVLPIVMETGRWEGQTRFRHFRTGAAILMLQNIFVIRDPAGRPLVLATISRDMTERVRAEEALREAHAELTHISRLTTMGELAASLAHELNQPLSAVVTNGSACLHWLERREPDLDEARSAVRRIIRDGNRAADVIAHTRAMLKKSTGEPAWLDISEVVREVLMLAQPETTRNRIAVRESLAEDLPPVLGDRVQLQQVLLNLIVNAVDAMANTDEASREITIRSQHQEIDRGPGVLVTLQDTGSGLTPDGLDRLFDAFYTTKAHGLGMGLSISRSIIERHGGRLWATVNVGPGTTFQFVLPAPDKER